MNSLSAFFSNHCLLAFTDGDRWRPGIGDPTFIGWFTAFAYLATAFLCWRAAMRGVQIRKLRLFWMALAALMLFLGINKQLDLQTEFTFLGRDFARATGWYENRRVVQGLFILLMAIGGFLTTAAILWCMRSELKRLKVAIMGVGFLVTFVVIRAASFHHVDQFLNFDPGGVRMNWVLELSGIALIAWPAWQAARRSADTGFVWVSGGNARS